MNTQPEIEPVIKPKPRSHTKKQEKRILDLIVPEKLFIYMDKTAGNGLFSAYLEVSVEPKNAATDF